MDDRADHPVVHIAHEDAAAYAPWVGGRLPTEADADTPCCVPTTPRGGDIESSYDPAQLQFGVPRKVPKGGSHLCADTYCLRY